MPTGPFALLHGIPRPWFGHIARTNCGLLVQAVEEEGDVVLEAGDSCGGGGSTGTEPGVGRGGVEAVGVGESGARHGRRRALDLHPDLARALNHRREMAVRV